MWSRLGCPPAQASLPAAPRQDAGRQGGYPRLPSRIADAPLLDHLIGSTQQRRRNRESERPGGLEVDHEFVLGRLLHGKIGGLWALPASVYAERCHATNVRGASPPTPRSA